MTMKHTSRHTDISTADYYTLQTEWKLYHCVTDVRQQYPIVPLFRGDLAHAQTMCTRLSLRGELVKPGTRNEETGNGK